MRESIQELEIAKLRFDNIRDHMDQEAIKGLADSIKAVGQLYPVRVRRDGEEFVLVDGHRRTAAKRLLGDLTILAIVEGDSVNEAASIQKAFIANAQREGLTPLASARAIARLMQETGWSASEAASQLGFPPSRVTKLLSFLKLPAELAERLSAKGVGASVAYQLSRIEDPEKQARMAEQLLAGQLTRDGIGGEIRRETASTPATKSRSARPAKSNQRTRALASLDGGRSVTVAGISSSLDDFIACLECALMRCSYCSAEGHSVSPAVSDPADPKRRNPCGCKGFDADRRSMSEHVKMEAAGIECEFGVRQRIRA